MEVLTENPGPSTKSRKYISVALSLILIVCEGTVAAWPSPVLEALNGDSNNPLGKKLTKQEGSLLVSLSTPGSIVGALIAGSLARKIGRKPILTIICIPSVIFFLVMAFGKSLWLYYVARFTAGIGIGGIYTILPSYICELADPKERGRFCSGIGVSMNIGMLLTYFLGYRLSFFWFHIILCIIPLGFFVIFPLFALETPYYLLRASPAKAELALRKLRGQDDVSIEFARMKISLREATENSSLNVFETKATRKALITGLGLTSLIIFTGTAVILNYTGDIFSGVESSLSVDNEMLIIGVVQLFVSIFTFVFTERFGRKTLLAASFACDGLSLLALGTFFFIQDRTDVSSFGWVPLASLIGYVVSNNIGAGPLGRSVLGEFIPLKVKSVTMAICTVYCSIGMFVTSFYFENVKDLIGQGETFWIFAACGIFGSIFILTYMVETKGKTLEQIQDEMSGVVPKRR